MSIFEREKKGRQKCGLFMQKKWLYKISSFYEERIDTAEDKETMPFKVNHTNTSIFNIYFSELYLQRLALFLIEVF